jgi:hypothetical protein
LFRAILSLREFLNPLFRPVLSLGKFLNPLLRAILSVGEVNESGVEPGDLAVDLAREPTEVFLCDGVSEFLEHAPERLRERLGRRLTERFPKILVNAKRVHARPPDVNQSAVEG